MASGDTLLIFGAWDGIPPASNYATVDTRNGHRVIDFDAGTDESMIFEGILPRHYAGGGLTINLWWMASSATSGNCIWNTQIERIASNVHDLDSDSFASAQAATGAADSTSGEPIITSIGHTSGAQMDSLAAGEAFRLKVTRDADNGSDTMTGDAELFRIEIREA